MTWPPTNTEPTPENWYFCDGAYGSEINRVSPEGNIFGQTRWIAEVTHKLWWTGSDYRYVEVVALHMSVSDLPTGVPFGEIRRVREYVKASNEYVWVEYWYNSEIGRWTRLQWLWTIDGLANLPRPGMQVGVAHLVVERTVPFVWDGREWGRFRHSMLNDDEQMKHLPDGFLNALSPDARVVYYSPTEIAIEAVKGGSGRVLVNTEYVTARQDASVFSRLAVLDWDAGTGSPQPTYLEPGAEYWIYLANTDNAFVVSALPGDSTHAATPAWDFRQRLFLSHTADVNGYLGRSGSGRNARIVGKIETDSTPESDGGPFFLQELDISLISRQVSLPETYREFSDFQLVFHDQDTLQLEKIGSTYGQMYIGGQLRYLGEGKIVTVEDPWIEWSDSAPKLIRHTGSLAPSTLYFVYVPGEVDPYNFNAVNPETTRPWQATDPNAGGHYQAALDMRLTLFLSTKQPDHGVLDEAWPGYYARHLGQVMTDGNGKLVSAWDLSAIRQATLNPSWFDGLAEIDFTRVSTAEFRICRKRGSSGIVFVRGDAVRTYDYADANVHTVKRTDSLMGYNEANQSAPLTAGNPIQAYPNTDLHVYLANSRPLWGSLAGRAFVSDHAPTGGYLSSNWPGNNARWLARIRPNGAGQVSSTYLKEGVNQGAITPSLPIGTMLDHAGPTAPDGYLPCDGSAISRAEYSDLFAVIGTTWGSGDGSTTFNVPDFRRRTSIGAGGPASSVVGASVGNVGGEEIHTLSLAEMPWHDHGGVTGNTQAMEPGSVGYTPWPQVQTFDFGATHAHSIAASGASQAHNNIQPSAVVLKIIKY